MSDIINYQMSAEVDSMDPIESDFFKSVIATNVNIDPSKMINEIDNIVHNVDFNNYEALEVDKSAIIANSTDYKICPTCNIRGKILETLIICEQCGMEREYNENIFDTYNMSYESNYNTSAKSFMTFNIIGNNAYCYHRSFLKTCADYSMYRNANNKKEIINRIYQYEGNKPPHNIINQTAELFDQIKDKGYVFRGDGKLGVIGACLYYTCIANNLTRTPKEIASIMNVDDKFISNGDRILLELNELGIITIPTDHEPIGDYLNQYLPIFGISEKYKQFIIDLITRMEKKHVHIKNESRTSTKCIGSIYLLTQRIPELHHIKKELIVSECHISKATFIKYYNLLMNNPSIVKKVFKKHRIPQPNDWRGL